MAVLFLALWSISILICRVCKPAYIPTNSIYGFFFSCVLTSIYHYLISFNIGILIVLRWNLKIVFISLWLMMWMPCMFVWLCYWFVHVCEVPQETRLGHQIPCSSRWLWITWLGCWKPTWILSKSNMFITELSLLHTVIAFMIPFPIMQN